MAVKTTKIRAGLYRVTTDNGGEFLVEDRWDEDTVYPWNISDVNAFHDPWRGSFRTKREAIAEIVNYLIDDPS